MSTPADGNGNGAQHDMAALWLELARQWQHVGPPMRPAAEDLAFCWDIVQEWVRHRGEPRVLLLGVTPELYRLPWPTGTDFLAVDRSPAMIDTVWPGPKEAVLCTDWLDMALPDSSRDIVVCDGGLVVLAYPQEQRRLIRILRDILSDQGLCVFRLFVPPSRRESPDAVIKDLLAGNVSSLNILKLRLWTALMSGATESVPMSAVWDAIQEGVPDLKELAARIGWSADQVLAISLFRGVTARCYLPTVDQVSDMFCGSPGGFELERVCVPSYELGECCPTVVFRRCSSAPVGPEPTKKP